MASNFLNNLAKKQEEKRKTDTTGAKANNTANNKANTSSKAASGKASDFLNNLANKQEKERSTKYGNASTVDANTDREQEARNTAFEMLKNKGLQNLTAASNVTNNKLNKSIDVSKANADIRAGKNGAISITRPGIKPIKIKEKWLTDKEEAWLDELERKTNAEDAARIAQRSYEFGKKHPILGTGESLLLNKLGGITAGIGTLNQKLNNKEIDPNSSYFSLITQSDAYREGAQQAIKNAANAAEGTKKAQLLDFLSSTGYSIAMSAADAALLGPYIGGASQGLSAGASALMEAKKNKATDKQALMQGIAQGTAEAFFEKFDTGGGNTV